MASKDATVEEAAGSAVETRITSTRVVSDWRPAKLLCKRFNIRDPYKQLPDVAPTEPASKGATLDSVFGEDDKHPSRKRIQNEVDLDLEELEKEFVDPLQNVKKADVDLFSELFSCYVCKKQTIRCSSGRASSWCTSWASHPGTHRRCGG